jgi:dynein light intermediate chain 1
MGERTDGTMEILRTVCLKCMSPNFHLFSFLLSTFVPDGTSLFYTTPRPKTLNVLRQYTLCTLFVPPAPAPDGAARNVFPFSHKPNTLHHDRIVFPAGWDSRGKIAVLRDGFDEKHGAMLGCTTPSLLSTLGSKAGAQKQYALLVQDQGRKACDFRILLCLHWPTDHNSRHHSYRSTIQH